MAELRRGHKGREVVEYSQKYPNKTCYEIANDLGVAVTTVYNNVGPRGKSTNNPTETEIKKFIKKNPGMSIYQVSKETGYSYNTVKKYVKG